MKFNEKLKALREEKGYTQEEIASKLNVARQSVSKWEQGINEPDFETVKKLCQIFDCGIDELIDDDHDVTTDKEKKKDKINSILTRIMIVILGFTTLMTFAFIASSGEEIIIHWDISGNITLGSKWFLLINLSIVAVGIMLLVVTKVLLKKVSMYRKYKVMAHIIPLVIISILCILQIVLSILQIVDHSKSQEALFNLVPAGAVSLVIPLGLLTHPKWNKRNLFLGFRTAYTLSSDEAWYKVNAFAAIFLTILSIISYVLILIFIDKKWALFFIGIILIGTIVPFIYQIILQNKEKKKS